MSAYQNISFLSLLATEKRPKSMQLAITHFQAFEIIGLILCRLARDRNQQEGDFHLATKIRITTPWLLSLLTCLTFPCITLAFSFSTTFFCDRYFLLSQRKKRGGGDTKSSKESKKGSIFTYLTSICGHCEPKAFLENYVGNQKLGALFLSVAGGTLSPRLLPGIMNRKSY